MTNEQKVQAFLDSRPVHNGVPEPPDPVHAEDCALAVNARHGCTCGAEPPR